MNNALASIAPRRAAPESQAAPYRNASAQIVRAVQQASAATGVDFAYLMDKASAESGFRTDVKAKTSSATGLFQFTEATWLNMVNQHGAKHGLGHLADRISQDESGQPRVDSQDARRSILALRNDPRLSALFAAELASDNKVQLESDLGRPVGRTELYMAHFLGAGGAAKFLKALDRNPQQPAASLLPEAAKANLPVFYEGGRPLSVGQIFSRFAAKFDDEPVSIAPARRSGPANFALMRPAEETIVPIDNGAQPWLTGTRSQASGKEPISPFTVMMLDALVPPTADVIGRGDGARTERTDEEETIEGPGLAPARRGKVSPYLGGALLSV
jgi:hypothetical protein